jgi:hypothetical protein
VAHQPAISFQFHPNIPSIAPVGAHLTFCKEIEHPVMNPVPMLRAFFKRPIQHPEFTGPATLLLSISAFGVLAALLFVRPVSLAFGKEYFIAGLVGLVIALLILCRTKLGTLLFVGLSIPYAYYVSKHLESGGSVWITIATTVMLLYGITSSTRKQIRYHITR